MHSLSINDQTRQDEYLKPFATLDRFGFDLRRKKLHEQADDPYHAISILLDKEKTRTIIDAGASIGDISQKLTEMFPLATVHAIEPYPPFHAHLEKLAIKNKSIRPAKLALSDGNGSKFLQVNKSEGTNSLLRSNEEGKAIYGDLLSTTGEIKVKTQMLDDFIHENSIEQVDLLKLDLQGGEINAVKGAKETLGKGRVKSILCEVMFRKCYERQSEWGELVNEIMDHGFVLYNFFDPQYVNGQLCQADGLFLHESIIKSALKQGNMHFHSYSNILID